MKNCRKIFPRLSCVSLGLRKIEIVRKHMLKFVNEQIFIFDLTRHHQWYNNNDRLEKKMCIKEVSHSTNMLEGSKNRNLSSRD